MPPREALPDDLKELCSPCRAGKVEVFIGRLRRKIGDPPLIHTVRHVGYTIR